MDWDVARYHRFADARLRPFCDLLDRIDAADPRLVVDLGAGPGNATLLLKRRWPQAHVVALDSSPAMIAKLRELPGLDVRQADLREWIPDRPVDVLISNAALQWVPEHLALLPQLVGFLAPGGELAVQVPGNFDAPSHATLRELGRRPQYACYLTGIEQPAAHEPADYLRALQACGCAVDVWETTYLQILDGEDPVFHFVAATGARPTLQALPPDLRRTFEAEYKASLRAAYPPHPNGTVLPFRRIFAVARREG